MRIESKIILIVSLWIVAARCQVGGSEIDIYESYRKLNILSYNSTRELERLGEEISHVDSISRNKRKYPCDSYYDYVCGEQFLINSVLGSMPKINDLVIIFNELKFDKTKFQAKTQLIDFFNSCVKVKSVDDCHVEAFENFRPLFGYIIATKLLNVTDLKPLADVITKFIEKAKKEGFSNHLNLKNLENLNITLTRQFNGTDNILSTTNLDLAFLNLSIFPSSYHHNIKNLKKYSKLYRSRSDFENRWKSFLDFTIYLYQSKNKPRSYFYPTLNVHLWMTLFNNTVRYHEGRTYKDLADCFKLPSYFDFLEEARNLAAIYYKSFKFAWDEYTEWYNSGYSVMYGAKAQDIYDKENQILGKYSLSNKHLFFIFYAQNFCFFGKEMAENIFYQGLKQSIDFTSIYQCSIGHTMDPPIKC